jgi:uncharacterized membrane protein YgdD (TMEM256/DUF423 family)
MKRLIACVCTVTFLMGTLGCAGMGKDADCVPAFTSYDKEMDCDEIRVALRMVMRDIEAKAEAKQSKAVSNGVLLGVGLLLFWPSLFFMDLSDTERKELQALKNRYDRLMYLAEKKGCDVGEFKVEQPEPKGKEVREADQGYARGET